MVANRQSCIGRSGDMFIQEAELRGRQCWSVTLTGVGEDGEAVTEVDLETMAGTE